MRAAFCRVVAPCAHTVAASGSLGCRRARSVSPRPPPRLSVRVRRRAFVSSSTASIRSGADAYRLSAARALGVDVVPGHSQAPSSPLSIIVARLRCGSCMAIALAHSVARISATPRSEPSCMQWDDKVWKEVADDYRMMLEAGLEGHGRDGRMWLHRAHGVGPLDCHARSGPAADDGDWTPEKQGTRATLNAAQQHPRSRWLQVRSLRGRSGTMGCLREEGSEGARMDVVRGRVLLDRDAGYKLPLSIGSST